MKSHGRVEDIATAETEATQRLRCTQTNEKT